MLTARSIAAPPMSTFVYYLYLAWWTVRCIKGLQLAGNRQPVPDPAAWMW